MRSHPISYSQVGGRTGGRTGGRARNADKVRGSRKRRCRSKLLPLDLPARSRGLCLPWARDFPITLDSETCKTNTYTGTHVSNHWSLICREKYSRFVHMTVYIYIYIHIYIYIYVYMIYIYKHLPGLRAQINLQRYL